MPTINRDALAGGAKPNDKMVMIDKVANALEAAVAAYNQRCGTNLTLLERDIGSEAEFTCATLLFTGADKPIEELAPLCEAIGMLPDASNGKFEEYHYSDGVCAAVIDVDEFFTSGDMSEPAVSAMRVFLIIS